MTARILCLSLVALLVASAPAQQRRQVIVKKRGASSSERVAPEARRARAIELVERLVEGDLTAAGRARCERQLLELVGAEGDQPRVRSYRARTLPASPRGRDAEPARRTLRVEVEGDQQAERVESKIVELDVVVEEEREGAGVVRARRVVEGEPGYAVIVQGRPGDGSRRVYLRRAGEPGDEKQTAEEMFEVLRAAGGERRGRRDHDEHGEHDDERDDEHDDEHDEGELEEIEEEVEELAELMQAMREEMRELRRVITELREMLEAEERRARAPQRGRSRRVRR